MTQARLSQVAAETLRINTSPGAGVSQVAVETLRINTSPGAGVSQVAVETLRINTAPGVSVSQVAVESLRSYVTPGEEPGAPGESTDQCICLDFATKQISTMVVPTAVTAARTDLLSDTMYLCAATLVLPQRVSTAMVGVWRSPKIAINSFPSFGWLRVEGPAVSAVVRLYGDGVLVYTTPTITSNDPVRLPAGRYREREIEVESATRITQVVLALTADELAAARGG